MNAVAAPEPFAYSKEAPRLAHLGYLDGIRAYAALYVVLHHALMVSGFNTQTVSLIGKAVVAFFSVGNYAVDTFIVLSGFCLMLPVVQGDGTVRGGAIAFYRRRARRILPPYYAAMFLSLVLIAWLLHEKTGSSLWDQSIPVTLKSIVTHLLLVHDLFGDGYTIDPVLWSIAVEWRIYLFFPLLVLLWRRFGAVATTAMAVLLSYIGLLACSYLLGEAKTIQYFGLFAMGMLGAYLVFSPPRKMLRIHTWKYLTFVLSVVVVVLSLKQIPILSHFRDYIVGCWASTLR